MGSVYEDEHWMLLQPTGGKIEGRILVSISLYWNSVKSPPRKELCVRISDDKEFTFLCSLRMNEEGFQQLKTQQGVLVDFGAFAERFVELLKSCKREENEDVPKFVLRLVESNENIQQIWTLHIVETNSFKHLTHLALKFFPADDKEVRDYLTACLKHVKEESHRLKNLLDSTRNDLSRHLSDTQKNLAEKSVELEQTRSELRAKETELIANFQQQLSFEKSKATEMKNTYEQRFLEDRNELEQTYSHRIKTLTSQLQEMEILNRSLTQDNQNFENQIRDCRRRLDSSEEGLQITRQELSHFRKQNEELETNRHDLEVSNHKQAMRIAVLQQEATDKEKLTSKLQEMLSSEQEQRKHFQEEAEQKSKQVDLLERSVQNYAAELSKGNEIIKKLQDEIVTYHNKVKIRNQIVTEQEKAVESKEKELDTLREEFKSLKMSLSSKDETIENLNEKLESMTKKYNECKQEVKSHENVIAWLNRQLTEQQQGQKLPLSSIPIDPTTMPSSQVIYRPHSTNPIHAPSPTFAPTLPNTYPTATINSAISSSRTVSNRSASPGNGLSSSGLDLKYLRPATLAPRQPTILSHCQGDTASPQEQSLTSAYFPKALQNSGNKRS